MNTIITETTEHGEMPVDVFTKLANDRILFINDQVDDAIAADISATILLKDSEETEKITLFLNTEGGDIRSIFMIYDMMKMVESPIETVCLGSALGEAALLLAAGELGMRYATKNSIISIGQLLHDHQILSDLSDAKSLLERKKQDNKEFMEALAKATKKSLNQVMKDYERKKFLTPKQALQYGLIDGIIGGK